jgi:hypothetical protein
MTKRSRRDEIARIILFECSLFESDAEIAANPAHWDVIKAYRAADRIAALPPADSATPSDNSTSRNP